MSKIIKLADDIEVEIHTHGEFEEISDISRVDSSIEELKKLLTKVIEPVSKVHNQFSSSSSIQSTKLTVGVKVGIEGNFFIAKSSTEANIQVEILLGKNNG